tara:strand:+ start:321 stop:443 length:123 start_codon:yes stop_codon:yes gene_type:complete
MEENLLVQPRISLGQGAKKINLPDDGGYIESIVVYLMDWA